MDFTSPSCTKGHVVLQVVLGQRFGSGLWSVCCVLVRNRWCGLSTIYIGKWATLLKVKISMQKKNVHFGILTYFVIPCEQCNRYMHGNVNHMSSPTSNKFYRFSYHSINQQMHTIRQNCNNVITRQLPHVLGLTGQ